MFTSRAEYRILLRQDNADFRLTPLGHKIGLITNDRLEKLEQKYSKLNELIQFLNNAQIGPNEVNEYLKEKETPLLTQKVKISSLLLRPQVELKKLIEYSETTNNFIQEQSLEEEILENVEIAIKYESYIKKEEELANKMKMLDHIKIPKQINYREISSLSLEARDKLTKVQPQNLGQASRISGVNPSDIAILMVMINK
jgi:tRNA uridine 5-carboxymethylaminomethyl modification enzyme